MNLARKVAVPGRLLSSRFGLSHNSLLQPEHRKLAIAPSVQPTCVHKDHSLVARCTDRQLLGFLFRHSLSARVLSLWKLRVPRYSDLCRRSAFADLLRRTAEHLWFHLACVVNMACALLLRVH